MAKSKKSNHWRVYWPGDFYYFDFYTDGEVYERDARRQLREDRNIKRLPSGLYMEPNFVPLPKYKKLKPQG